MSAFREAIAIIYFCSAHWDFEKLVSDISYLNKSVSINKLSAISTSGVNTKLRTGPRDKKGSWLVSDLFLFFLLLLLTSWAWLSYILPPTITFSLSPALLFCCQFNFNVIHPKWNENKTELPLQVKWSQVVQMVDVHESGSEVWFGQLKSRDGRTCRHLETAWSHPAWPIQGGGHHPASIS